MLQEDLLVLHRRHAAGPSLVPDIVVFVFIYLYIYLYLYFIFIPFCSLELRRVEGEGEEPGPWCREGSHPGGGGATELGLPPNQHTRTSQDLTSDLRPQTQT